jgi:hypothetical protein
MEEKAGRKIQSDLLYNQPNSTSDQLLEEVVARIVIMLIPNSP